MRRLVAVLMSTLLLVACGGGAADDPEVTISDVSWDSDTITVEADTNLPDGAVLSWYLVDGDDWDDIDAADVSGFADVSDGQMEADPDVAAFGSDQALIQVSFVPRYDGQPDDVADTYEPNQGATDETEVAR